MKQKKSFTGVVISSKMKDTVVVEVEHRNRHPLYKKTVRRTKHFAAHVRDGEYAVGDYVKIEETRPLSKTKHFLVTGKVTK